jgi:pyruvate dehydrogenase E2 component (dihydrolipoamide acetyltransferase)
MPALSPTMEHGNIAKWLKAEGDKIKPGDVLLEIETDKATMEVEAVDSGILAKILVAEGTENVAVNKLIALMIEVGEDMSNIASYQSSAPAAAVAETLVVEAKPAFVKMEMSDVTKIFASPLAKRIAETKNIDLAEITGSGPYGRIIKMDVLEYKVHTKAAATGRQTAEYIEIPNNNMRKTIAKRLCESKQTVPHFYLSIDCELDNLLACRAECNALSDTNKLSVNDFIIKASAMALQKVPAANSSWTDAATLQYCNVDISVAVAIPGGLITPIIRNADQTSLSNISLTMKDLGTRAKTGKLAPEEFQGGSFTISNLGMYGIDTFTAIVNPPQGAILAVGSGTQKPVVKNGQMQIATVMTVVLSCDHRVIDGAVGAEFLSYFKKFIESPVTMLV